MAKVKAPRGYKKAKLTDASLKVLEERYLTKNKKGAPIETPEGLFYRVAKAVASNEKNYNKNEKEVESLTHDFYDLMASGAFLPNSPTLMNAGKNNKLQYSGCFVLPVEDSLEAIFEAVKNAALIHKSGGGTGFSFSRLRSKGASVSSTSGVASGPVSFMRVFDSATAEVKQGGTRRGANMGVLRVDHPDIEEFIESKSKGGITNFNISVAITDEFIKAFKADKSYWLIEPSTKKRVKRLKARFIFDKIVKQAWTTGDPGVVFIDSINNSSANPVPSMGPIESTNPCLLGSSLVATEEGLLSIESLVSKKAKIKALTSDADLQMRRENIEELWDRGEKEIWKLVTKAGFELTATADHKVMTKRGWVALSNLKLGQDFILLQKPMEGNFSKTDKLPFSVKNNFKGENGTAYNFNFPSSWTKELGQVLGWLVGDGWVREDKKDSRVGFVFGEDDREALVILQEITNLWYGKEIKAIKRENSTWHLSYHSKYFLEFFKNLGLKVVKADKKEVPSSLYMAKKEAVIGFLQALFTADGTIGVDEKRKNKYIRLTSKSNLLLKQVQILLLQFGILSRIYNRSRSPRESFSYKNKQSEEKKDLSDGVLWELNISKKSLEIFLKEIGFIGLKHKEKIDKIKSWSSYSEKFEDQVLEVKNLERKEKVYDLTITNTNQFFANGILVHNCGEQPLYPNESCNLGSINLSLMEGTANDKDEVNWKKLKKTTQLSVRFLDDIIDINPFPLEIITRMVLKNRRVGLGVMGWADLLFKLGVAYNSEKAFKLGEKIMTFIQKQAHLESQRLAKEKGAFPAFKQSIYRKGLALRNSTLTTIAPTGSISIIAGCSSGIEPLFALCFKHKANDRELTFVNPYFKKAAKRYKISDKTYKEIEEKGTLHDVKGLPKKLKDVFVTAHEIDWKDHLKMQAAFQKGTDNAVSKTINLPNEAPEKQIEKAYLYAHKAGCMGVTVFRDGCRSEQVLYSGVKEEEKQETQEKPKETIKPRPKIVSGQTYRVETPVGTAFVTVNTNGGDEPLEVFVNVGKAGSDIAADAEAIGRLISLNLRIGSLFSASEVLVQIIDQLDGIGGGESVGFGPNKIRSLADGIAKVLSEYIQVKDTAGKEAGVSLDSQQPSLLRNRKRRDLCPKCGRASLIFEEGCSKCLYCGYNKC